MKCNKDEKDLHYLKDIRDKNYEKNALKGHLGTIKYNSLYNCFHLFIEIQFFI